MMLRASLLPSALLLALAAATPAAAVDVADDGTGGALIVPYYTVDKGNTTIVTVTNQAERPTAAKFNVREARNGRVVLSFHLYLAAKDRWTAVITSLDATGAAILLTTDSSCTVPAIATSASLPSLPSGIRYVPFRNQAYTGDAADGDPSLARTRQGMIEIIEMGTLTGASAAATSPSARNCAQLLSAWSAGGYWTANPGTDMSAPAEALAATAEIVDVAKGAAVVVPITALEGFRSPSAPVLHEPPSRDSPSLGEASEGIDAVSAELLKRGVANEFTVEPALGAQTEWIVTFPTKRQHTDSAIVGATARPPFRAVTGTTAAQFAASCVGASFGAFGSDGRACSGTQCTTTPLCGVVTQVRFTQRGETRPGILFGDKFSNVPTETLGAVEGFAELFFLQVDSGQPFAWSYAGATRTGLPAIGFSTGTFVNSNAGPGVLAVYARTTPHRDVVGNAPPAAAGAYFENASDFAIADNTTVESPITVSGVSGTAPATLRVGVDIKHTYIGDLQVDLVAPDGSVYPLHNRSGTSTDNILTTYTVNASTELANGAWKLRVADGANGDTGFIDKWSLQF
jgi:hypothetical protein